MKLEINTEVMSELGDNILVELVEKRYLVFVVDTTLEQGLSKSGKSQAVASTNGFTSIIRGFIGNVWIGKKVK